MEAFIMRRNDKVLAEAAVQKVQKTYLKNIVKNVIENFGKDGCFLKIFFDSEECRKADVIFSFYRQLDLDKIQFSILNSRKTKNKIKREQITINQDDNSINIEPKVFKLFSPQKNQLRTVNIIFELQIMKRELAEVRVRGLEKVIKAQAVNIKKEGPAEYKIMAEGSGLREFMRIPEIDFRTATSNDFREVLNALGIEATRRNIFNQIHGTMKNHNVGG